MHRSMHWIYVCIPTEGIIRNMNNLESLSKARWGELEICKFDCFSIT